MIVVDFRNWNFNKLGYLPNAQKVLLQKDFETINAAVNLKTLDAQTLTPISLSNLFFENENIVGVSPIKNIKTYYDSINAFLGIKNKEVIDYTEAADEEVYFHGTNSIVAHLNSEIALCGINQLTDESIFEEYCEDFELNPFSFDIPDDKFTSDIAIFVKDTLLICLDYISDKKVKKQLFSLLKQNGIKTITFTKEQVNKGVFNIKFIDDTLLLTSQSNNLLTADQKKNLTDFKTEIVELPFLEKAGIKLRDIIL